MNENLIDYIKTLDDINTETHSSSYLLMEQGMERHIASYAAEKIKRCSL